MTIAGFVFMGFSAYGLVESRRSNLAITLMMCAVAIFLTGLILTLLVTPRGHVRRNPKFIWILIIAMLLVTVAEIVIWALLMHDWAAFLKQCMLLEYPQSIITRWFDKNKIVVQVILFLGVPFQVLWFMSAYILAVGHF